MAKRKPPRSDAADGTTTAQPQPRRSRGSTDERSVDPGPHPEALNTIDAGGAQSPASDPSEEDIRRRAYLRYLERGGGDGMAFEDWLEAERELRVGSLKSEVGSRKSEV
jgi:hypothetical protein